MAFFKRAFDPAVDMLLSALVSEDNMTKREALNIPSVATCVDIISSIVAMLPIKLYQDDGEQTTEIKNDRRIFLLNDETGDLLDSYQMKKAWVTDFLLDGAGYVYIQRRRNEVRSLHYVAHNAVAAIVSPDPIFKSAYFLVNGQRLCDFEFLKLTRRTEDGVTGSGVIAENSTALAVAYNALIYENFLVKTGGNKKGFLKAAKKLDKDAMTSLKTAFQKMYKNNSENVVVLNDGLDFQEASNTSVEMQLNENKKTNAHEMCKLFNMPPSIIDGTAKDEDNSLFFKVCISPILVAIETALNKDLLLASEKPPANTKGVWKYFAVDTKELLKGDMVKRFSAYKMAIESNIMQIDECRYLENLPKLGLTFIKLGLQDVLYDPKTGEVYTPNTDKTTNLTVSSGFKSEGGEKTED